ncbi:protein kinase [Prescottella soli]|uniref:protein kinase domain-containing protein n=1 Tax=Prescottella soli TaxID=1543852 RepID=UPI0032AE8E78
MGDEPTQAAGDPQATQRGGPGAIETELAMEGFEDAVEIGRGGYGVVYRCTESSLDRTVAVKIARTEVGGEGRERFLREQRALGKLTGHPHVVEVLQVGVTATGRPYIVMPFRRLGSLDAAIRRDGPFDWPEALRLAVQLTDALDTAHRLGILHRDIKPANILITDYGDPELSDFGIARVPDAFESRAGDVVGTPDFTAPEILVGAAPTPASDVYSMAGTIFHLLTGHAAFQLRRGEKPSTQLRRLVTETIPDLRPAGVPDDLCRVLEQAMSVDTADRPATAADLAEQLRDVQRGHELTTDVPTPRPSGPVRRTQPPQPPTPVTKFRPPVAEHAFVERARLVRMLDDTRPRLLSVIHAPAGFGKTVLAAQWRDVLLDAGVSVAWLSLDSQDDNVAWFLGHLLQSVRQVRPELTDELGQAIEEFGVEAERFVLTSLINRVHDSGARLVVVIDDWHRVSDPATVAALNFLLGNACHHLGLVVTTRTRSGLPLGSLRVRDELVEIDESDLRFDAEESRRFLVDRAALDLDPDTVQALQATTDGWAAALQLASLSLRGREDPVDVITHLSGRSRAIGEYLADNVVGALDPHLLDFLLCTSVPERVSGPLASRLADVPDGQSLLEEVEERDLFLRAEDVDRSWFRYHQLFADYLRRRLERDPDRVADLHRRASSWFLDHSMLREAVDHALAAGDAEQATDLVEHHGMGLVEHSLMATVLGLVDKLPPQIATARPRLLLTQAWAHVLLHHPPRSVKLLLEQTRSLLTDAPDGASTADLLAESALVDGVCDLFADRVGRLADFSDACLRRRDTLSPFVLAGAVNLAEFDALYRFDFDSVRRWQERQSVEFPTAESGPFVSMYGSCFAGIAAGEQLDYEAADGLYRRAGQLAREHGGRRSYAARLVGALTGDRLYQQGRLDDADQLFDECHLLGAEGGAVDFMLLTYGTGARVKALRGDPGGATTRLSEGAAIARTLGLSRLAARIENDRARCGLPHEKVDPADLRWPPDDGIAIITADLLEDTAIRDLLTQKTSDAQHEAVRMARARVDRIAGRHRPLQHLRAQLLHAACLFSAGDRPAAFTALEPPLLRCADLGLPRTAIDAAPRMVDLIDAYRQDATPERAERLPG